MTGPEDRHDPFDGLGPDDLAQLDDPAPPVPTTDHRTEVGRRARRRRARRHALVGGAGAAVVLVGLAVGLVVSGGGSGGSGHVEAAASQPDVTIPGNQVTGGEFGTEEPLAAGSANGKQNDQYQLAHPPCPADQKVPTSEGSTYCGPTPRPGNGLGPKGQCTGRETLTPCAPGVVPSVFYAYTLSGTCGSAVLFDGQRWYLTSQASSDGRPVDVWIELAAPDQPAWVGKHGTGVLVADRGQARQACAERGTTPTTDRAGG